MKNEYIHMQALHRKLDVILVEILPLFRNRLQLLRGFAPQQDSALHPDTGFTHPFSAHCFFRSATPD